MAMPKADPAGPNEQLCLDLTNQYRRKKGKPPLLFSKRLSQIAMPHSIRMLNMNAITHDGFPQRSRQVPEARSHGENVGFCRNQPQPIQEMMKQWINSPPHRKNLLGDFTHLGIAFAQKDKVWFGTQFFAHF
jgi:uncharacterized protein YkwD